MEMLKLGDLIMLCAYWLVIVLQNSSISQFSHFPMLTLAFLMCFVFSM